MINRNKTKFQNRARVIPRLMSTEYVCVSRAVCRNAYRPTVNRLIRATTLIVEGNSNELRSHEQQQRE